MRVFVVEGDMAEGDGLGGFEGSDVGGEDIRGEFIAEGVDFV
jgi:hypothetical protein